jgi:hypothetical protein
MPIYLVRWPSLRASLVRARSEAELLDILDEVASPGECTWRVYRGPLWIDLKVPVRYRIEERFPGRLRAEEVVVEDVSGLETTELVPKWPEFSDTAYETRAAVLRSAFPALAAALDAADEESDDTARLRAAVVEDLAGHAAEVFRRGVTFDEDLQLLATRTWCFRRLRPGRFSELAPELLEDFCGGLASLPAEKDGVVRTAVVAVALRHGRPCSARIALTLRLRADRHGLIDPLHRIDAYARDDDDPGSALRRFEARRNDAVRWTMSATDRRALIRAVNAKAGRTVLAEDV